MLLDVSLLRRAKVENIERLAKSLGMRVPSESPSDIARSARAKTSYQNQLASAVIRELRRDALRAEFERLSKI